MAKWAPGRAALDAAFKRLEKRGIVALQDVGDTISQGWESCNDRAHWLRLKGKPPRGAVFYHGQDAARARRGEGVFLVFGAYGATDAEHAAASLAIANDVIEVLVAHGFTPVWDGTIAQRIHTGPFPWS